MSERFKAVSQQHSEEMQGVSQESELVSKYNPTLIGAGNDHFVYEAEGHPNSVIKINRESIKYALNYCLSKNSTTEQYAKDTEAQAQVDTRIEYFKLREQELRNYFGNEHCLNSRFVKIKIPTIPSFYKGMAIDDATQIPDELLVVAMVQARALENFTEDDSVHTWYLKDDPDAFAYVDYTTSALTNTHGPLARPKRPDLSELESRNVIRDFVERAIQYTKKTGRIMDLNGVNNVVLTHNEDGALSYTLVDALFPAIHWDSVVQDVAAIIEKQKTTLTDGLTQLEKNKVKVTANYIRFINELASSTSTEERLDQLESADEETQEALKSILTGLYAELPPK